ncbi:MAG: hypothetical protein KatS3mg056_1052 [Chloroflexus sp.]|nr:MAG: hypothetical protein KatS3mg056_1052 [Chloroflexus sp.]
MHHTGYLRHVGNEKPQRGEAGRGAGIEVNATRDGARLSSLPIPHSPSAYALPITMLSTSSRIRSAYLVVRDPRQYRIVPLLRWSRVTNGKRMVAVVAAVDSVSDRGAGFQSASGGQHLPAVAMMPARRLEACATGSRHGERLQPELTQRDMWVMHSPLGAGTTGKGWRSLLRAGLGLRYSAGSATWAVPVASGAEARAPTKPDLMSDGCR